ncbi:MAG TPA: DUF4856 domain-containing protein [Cytophagaceae bacterium]|jgi:hypothetical protein
MQITTFSNRLLIFVICIAAIAACRKPTELPEPPTIGVLTVYNFNNVNYSAQKVRSRLLDTLILLARKPDKVDKAAHLAVLTSIFSNTKGQYTSKVSLEQVTRPEDKTPILTWFDSLASRKQNFEGNSVFINHDGSYLPELIEKKMLGSIFYDQAVNTHLRQFQTKDNIVVKKDSGTAMEHSWDEAFGYFGGSVSQGYYTKDSAILSKKGIDVFTFMTLAAKLDTDYLKFTSIPTNFTLDFYQGFINGRDAISRNDVYAALLEKDRIIENWDRLITASAVSDLEDLRGCFSLVDPYEVGICKSKKWTAVVGTLDILQYNPSNRLGLLSQPASAYSKTLEYLGNNSFSTNLEGIEEAKKILKSTYGF